MKNDAWFMTLTAIDVQSANTKTKKKFKPF